MKQSNETYSKKNCYNKIHVLSLIKFCGRYCKSLQGLYYDI